MSKTILSLINFEIIISQLNEERYQKIFKKHHNHSVIVVQWKANYTRLEQK